MHTYGSAAMSDLLGDLVAYRSLRPADARLPSLAQLAARLGLPAATPRKGDEAYARVVVEVLRAARHLTAPGAEPRRLILVGDTRMSDGGAFTTIRDASGWEGRAFIGADRPAEPPAVTVEGDITYANRWAALDTFAAELNQHWPIDAGTVVLLDIDKTLIGARGRNDGLIDSARRRALRAAVAEALGDEFDESTFGETYSALDQSRYHPFTGDNQDTIGYLCLLVAGGFLTLPELLEDIDSGRLRDIAAVARLAVTSAAWPTPAAARAHDAIAERILVGDPTPFKAFRHREFVETAALMGRLPDGTPAEDLLRGELVLTAEVWQAARAWQERGALLFGLSDKPDEAALPAEDGATPLHRIRTHLVGS